MVAALRAWSTLAIAYGGGVLNGLSIRPSVLLILLSRIYMSSWQTERTLRAVTPSIATDIAKGSTDTATGSPVRLRAVSAKGQPEVTPALEELYRGFEQELLVPLWTEIGGLMPARTRRPCRICGAGSS
jgi:hypothetical protein